MPKSSLRQLLKFVGVFGITSGIRLWCALSLQLWFSSGLLKLNVPGLAAPVHLRRRDLPIFWQILVIQEYDFEAFPQASRAKGAYRSLLADGKEPTIVDCGGHIGLSAVWFASHFPESVVYCIEPDTSNFELLKQNTGLYSNVIALHGGIWKRPCHLKISNPLDGNASFRLQEVCETGNAEPVDSLRGYSIEEILGRDGASHLFLIKIDIEGAESELFEGPTAWLESATMLTIELHDWLMPGLGTSRNFLRRIAENKFDVVLHGENLIAFRIPEPLEATQESLHT